MKANQSARNILLDGTFQNDDIFSVHHKICSQKAFFFFPAWFHVGKIPVRAAHGLWSPLSVQWNRSASREKLLPTKTLSL